MNTYFFGGTELPYSYKRRSAKIFRFLNIVWYDVYFEDTKIRSNITFDDAKELVHLLNAAWTTGYGSGFIQGTYENTHHSNN